MPRLSATYYDLKLTYRFTIARSSKTEQRSMIVTYEDQGYKGYGECTSHEYYDFSVENGLRALEQYADLIASIPQERPENFYDRLLDIFPDTPFLRCAIDEAYWDWYGKKTGQTTRKILGISETTSPVTSYTIGIDSLERMKDKITQNPWSSYKIKLSADHDLDFVNNLLDYIGVPLYIDANASWSKEDLIHMGRFLNPERVRFIEQPMERSAWETMSNIKDQSSIPLIADESFVDMTDMDKCEASFDGVNIKLMKCGGITPAYKLIQEARKRNLLVMIGCMTESSVGISAASQLAPLADYIDLDGSMLISNDPASGTTWTPETILWSTHLGNGAQLKH